MAQFEIEGAGFDLSGTGAIIQNNERMFFSDGIDNDLQRKGNGMVKRLAPPATSASDIAKYFLWRARKEGKSLTNKKLSEARLLCSGVAPRNQGRSAIL